MREFLRRSVPAAGIAAFAALAATCLAVPPSVAEAQSAPVSVRTCTVLAYAPSSKNEFFYLQSGPPSQVNRAYSDGLHLAYVNTSRKVMTRVGFRVTYGGATQRVIDTGTISPGVTIDKTFGEFSGQAYLGSLQPTCTPIGARFKDGSVWRASATPSP
jgi:hypothetical protein